MRRLLVLSILLLSSLANASDFLWANKTGIFSISTYWTETEFSGDALAGKLKFTPHDDECVSGFIQVAKMTDNKGKDLVFKKGSGLEARNEVKTLDGSFVDYNPTKCKKGKPCSPYYIEYWPTDGSYSNEVSARMADYPFGWEQFSKIELEACAVCKGSEKKVLGCISWGGEFPVVGDKKVSKPTWKTTSSPEFDAALKKFNTYYNNH